MAREEFLLNLRTAAKFLSPKVQVNGVRLRPEFLERVLRQATIWLTSRAIEGFDAKDYPELRRARATGLLMRSRDSELSRIESIPRPR
jgi:hypothetical protein